MIYTGIGSRKTPEHILKLMKQVGYELAQRGYTLRSGKAQGADSAFQQGVMQYVTANQLTINRWRNLAQIYIPWKTFNPLRNGFDIWDICLDDVYAEELAAACMHPDHWNNCSSGARKLHTRNVHQVLGSDLKTPSQFVLYWCPEVRGKPTGGTATAVKLATTYGIPCINMLHEDWYQRVQGILDNTWPTD